MRGLKSFLILSLVIYTVSTSFVANAAFLMKPTPLPGIDYKGQLLDGPFRPEITSPNKLLNFPVGQKTATPEQIVQVIKTWESQSNNLRLVEYARSHEGRPLYYAIISSRDNLEKVDRIKSDLAKLANPVGLSKTEGENIIARLPAVAWMAYSIHGNESSGSDASLAAIYHLIASQKPETLNLLNSSVIVIDPSMNPDGRARFTKALQQNRGVAPNIDDQSLLHAGIWPYGRTNHYLFDLNRDFILGVHPETRGRVRAINEWHPQLMIDAHEMGAQSTFLFAPAREPINKNLAKAFKKWGEKFAQDQANAFDRKNWPYFTGEWFENLYPGYSSYAEFRGSIHILYEQARMAEDGVRQTNDRILTYRESVHHQLLSTLQNLDTLAKHSKAIYREYLEDRRKVISADSPYADTTFAFPPSKNLKRWREFVALLQLQGFELHELTKDSAFSNAVNQLGEKRSIGLPKGSLIVRNRQPEARLLSAILEFDAKIEDAVLVEERQRVLRDGSSLMYDTTAWNLSMMHGIEGYTLNQYIDSNIQPYSETKTSNNLEKSKNVIAYSVDGDDDASVAFAARLMEQGVQVRILDKPTKLADLSLSRGSIIVNKYDNEFFSGNLEALVEQTAKEVKIKASTITKGLGDGDYPDIGGAHFNILKKPQIALLTGNGISTYDFGAIWHTIDKNLGIRHSHLDSATLTFADLRRYNTLVIPDRFYGNFGENELNAIEDWVNTGGTLILIGHSALDFVKSEKGISQIKQLSDVFPEIDKYNLDLTREWLAGNEKFEQVDQAWQHNAFEKVDFPWDKDSSQLNTEELQKRESWQSRFMPSGAIVSARMDQKHWLTYGTPEFIPALVQNVPILMSGQGSQAPARFGYYKEMDKNVWQKISASFKDKTNSRKIGWASMPDGYELKLRMSGLLWPEASNRIANAALLTRESKGNGQIIIFATQPAFRGSTKATNRLFLNALVYGVGLGTSQPITKL
ncbi:M14 family zinc carboxypeptidase [Aliikangiella sp. G2MR2-5]|uniref:M14 family zinc carboxypeptidase n=1 Tax=Aliikangiella sp. G2MR2-5 TaxID=2788943 RepID=UPI0018A8D0F8|nr:M14 family zinc carboxypeptidase [Aliikangiella sp. G2MR2-5]